MALNVLPDNNIPPFPSEAAPLKYPRISPPQLLPQERNLASEGLSFTTEEMKTQSAVEELLLGEEEATPLFQRRAAVQQTTTTPSTLPRTGAISLSASTGSVMSITTNHASEFPPAPMEGRPINFGLVVPGVYRSSYPKAEDYGFLKDLKLKTVVTLVKRDEIDHEFETFVTSNGIRQVVFNMKGTKKEPIPSGTMSSILDVVLDHRNYPLLLHCNHGKHRTGCVVAVVRKMSGWTLDRVVDEYKTYATPKIRECDVDYITSFQSSSLDLVSIRPFHGENPRFSPVQVRSFMRTLLFTAFVATLWLVSGSRIAVTRDGIPN
ncbi:tyrosine phosphatase [Trichoderma arundinaceum]|uniref:diphosphoinositol-polyphosphate diphosphatase n=1 Tax=Trichoderma arundinaceum TaxID=490622 RepID=A0A395P165_TRIAR|nr:tyrosine phosphatase [Trichoderma arundinaceum]